GEEETHALLTQLGESRQVGGLAVDRRRVELEVARVEDDPLGGVEGHCSGVRDGMTDPNQTELERPVLAPLPHRHWMELRSEPHLLDAPSGELQGEPGPVDRDVDVPQEIGEGSHVVLVAMREYDEVDVFSTLGQPRPIREHQIDTQHVLFGEHEAAVDEADPAFDLESCTVAPDLSEPAQERQRYAHAGDVGGRRFPIAFSTASTVSRDAATRGRRGSPTGSHRALIAAFKI